MIVGIVQTVDSRGVKEVILFYTKIHFEVFSIH